MFKGHPDNMLIYGMLSTKNNFLLSQLLIIAIHDSIVADTMCEGWYPLGSQEVSNYTFTTTYSQL